MPDNFLSSAPVERQDFLAYVHRLTLLCSQKGLLQCIHGHSVKRLQSKICKPVSGSSHGQKLMHLTCRPWCQHVFPCSKAGRCLSA